MDAQAYLLRHGWSGPGNPLNPNRRPGTHGGLGLTRPILVARRSGNQGVGKKTTKDPTNQWWLRGFEDALKDVGKEKSADAVSKPNALTSELYRFFVRGEVIAGTLGDKDEEKTAESGSVSKKRKVHEEDEESSRVKKVKKDGETKEERHLRREEKKKRKEEEAKRKVERRKAREEKRLRKEEEAKQKMERRKAREEKRLRREMKKRAPEEDYPTPPLTEQEQTDSAGRDESSASETKEQRKVKKEKKDRKEDKKRKREEASTDDGSKSISAKSKDKKKSQA